MKYIRGFLMAWGMFCWIPCPYKKWHEDARYAQLAMLPLVGAFMGAICCIIWWPLDYIGAGKAITGAVLTGAYFLMTGFIHLDGFMDCSDAVMPRHPEMEERRRILKEPHIGSFGAVCLGLMLFVFAGSWITMSHECSLETCLIVIMIFTLSRMTAALNVMLFKPMSTSQYAPSAKEDKGVDVTATILVGAIITVLAMIGAGRGMFLIDSVSGALTAGIVAAVTVGIGFLVGLFDREKLGGMNGDISGHMITVSEMCGMMTIGLII